jgi:hypothetical protein
MEKLMQLVDTLKTQQAQKADYVLDSRLLVMKDGQIVANGNTYDPNRVMHEGLSDKLGIPMKYYEKLQTQLPGLLDQNVNGWLQQQAGKNVLLRTFEGVEKNIARAFLSDRYLALDNYDVLFAVLDAIKQMGVNVEIKNADVTDKRLYLNVVAPDVEIQAEAFLKEYLKEHKGVGNGILSGFTISNSEVGCGQFSVRPRAVIIKCNNGLIRPDDSFSRVHLGGKLEQGAIQWSQETRNRNLQLVMSQVKDAITTYLSKDYLGRIVADIARAHEIKLEHPLDAVKNLCKDLRYTDAQQESILNFFVKDGDTHASGVVHAITRHAQGEDPDTRHDMERQAFEALGRVHKFDHVAKN